MEHLKFVQVMTTTSKPYFVFHLEGRSSLIRRLIILKIFNGVLLAVLSIKALGIGHMKQRMKLMLILLINKVLLAKDWLLG